MTREELNAQIYSAAQAEAALGVSRLCMHNWRRNGILIPLLGTRNCNVYRAQISKRSWLRAGGASPGGPARKRRPLPNERAPENQNGGPARGRHSRWDPI